ncbi:serine-rich adhesin for platelets [Anastrepha obliqua]|uniref:serine-rich adhesin for platelets n=1 Tax=Anastrepha obliqua TaxID=95512 RepID=UPI0024098558|nr:serine-rich adhesin for platelets [Anastrepha obliqua]
MDAVVLHSDIARLVLGYLKRQNLERTSRLFCKTSPHLKQEFSAYKKGFIPHSFCPDLEDIICEYVNISRTVDRVVTSLPDSLRLQLFESKLSEKVKFLLERALESFLKLDQSENATLKQSDAKHSSVATTSIHSDKENTAKKHIKRKRKRASMVYSPDEQKSSVALASKSVKKRRILEPFCYLSAKQLNLKRKRLIHITSTADEQTQTDDEIEEESSDEEGNEVVDEDANEQLDNDSDLSQMENPTKESTPKQLSFKGKFLTPSVPELSQAILDNPHFRMKLVDNINQALNNSTNNESQTVLANINTASASATANAATLTEEQQIINSNEMLDQMVKDILKATEKDPAFDAIVENVVGASMQPSIASAGVQCNIDSNPLTQALLQASTGQSIVQQQQTAMVGQQQQFTLVQQQPQQHHQQLAIPCLSAVSNDTAGPTTAPRTPLIIRTAVAAASSSLSAGSGVGESQVISSLATNNAFGSLIDPNFSISKLIVLNPNDSAQKHLPPSDQGIGNTTADNLLSQLNSGVEVTDETVFLDTNTGQLTIPVFLTDEGLLANFPFLCNNEAVTQQLQSDNICNLDSSRIEIPLPEPIVVSAGQLPPNSVIVTSAQKATAIEEQHLLTEQQSRTVCKKSKEGPTPTSANVHSNADGETPSTSGIINTKAFKSLSTPRKRTSHVRTLSFSPKIETNVSSSLRRNVLRGGTVVPKSNAGDEGELTNAARVPEKPIIKNVEILPRLEGSVDVSASESSNSCSVPPLFVNEESSNQTIIKNELSLKENKGASVMVNMSKTESNANSTVNDHPDTPKRKQIRRTAVRACKRRLSKASDDKDKPNSIIQLEENETKEKVTEGEHLAEEQRQTKFDEDKMMEEWVRLRKASTSDLDSRLRQLNAEHFAAIPRTARRRKNTPEKRRSLRRKKNVLSKRMRKKAALAKLEFEKNKEESLVASDNDDCTKTSNEGDHVAQPEIKVKEKAVQLKNGQEKKRASKDKSMEFNIKIPTPQKDKREALMKTKSDRSEHATANLTKTSANDAVDNTTVKTSIKRADEHENNERLEHERDRRTANIACLLETPFKVPSTLGEVPPTPGIPALSLDTPVSKLADVPLSTSYLFGSLTKSELETPQLSAITPGFRFTPFGSDVTPRTNAPATDYSSGGSYYKPDESDDLDRKFDKLLRDSAQKQKQEEEENAKKLEQHSNATEVKNALFEEQSRSPELDTEQQEAAICVEIPAEKLRVEPIVLKRVKSFGAENTDNGEGGAASLNVDPHYTLVSELPEICAEEESSSSSTTFSSSSSSSSDSSSTSSSSSSNSNTSHNGDGVENDEEQKETTDDLKLSLDNLSSISSTEDEEWQKLAVTEEENSQLVSNDGEVRYPVRSWLTPSKVDNQATADAQEQAIATKIKVTVPLKSVEKRNRLEDDLQQKRERMMEKLKKDSNQQRAKQLNLPSTTSSGITAALSATRKIAAMREKTKCQPTKASTSMTVSTKSEPKTAKPVVAEKRTVEMLTALELSARKPQQVAADESKTRATAVATPPLSAVDDNATSTLFSSPTKPTATTFEITEKTERLPLKKFISKVKAKQRQCVQIQALPAVKASRSSCIGRKKIVRKPLGFKGTLATDVVEEVGLIEDAKSPLKMAAKSTDEDNESEKDASVSPVPKIKIKTPIGTATVTGSKLRVSPRFQGNKNAKAKSKDVDDDKEVQTKPLKTTKTVKTRAPTAKKLLAACIKVTPVRKKITKGKNATRKDESKSVRLDDVQAQDTPKDPSVEDTKTDAVPEKMHAEEAKPHKQEQGAKAKEEKLQKKKDADRIKEEKQKQVVKTHKALPREPLAKDVEKHKPTDAPIVNEVTEGNEMTKTKDVKLLKSQIPLPTEIAAATEKTQISDQVKKTVTVKKDDMQKLKTRATESGKSVIGIPMDKPTEPESQGMLKTVTADGPKLNDEKVGEKKIEAQKKSTEKEVVRKGNEQQENARKTELAETTSLTRTATPTSTTTNVGSKTTESSEDDPLEGCELTTVTDEDPVRYISLTYAGPDGPPRDPLPRRDFSNFKMVVAFDEDEKHIWRITDELMLFHASPATQQIRNIPKKRKVRINTCGSDLDNVPTVGVVHSTTTTLASTSTSTTASMTTVSSSRSANNANAGSREAKPIATSTPTSAPATSSTQESKKLISKVTMNTAAASSKALTMASTTPLSTETTANSTAGKTEVLQMDDIESLLSHLHGSAN